MTIEADDGDSARKARLAALSQDVDDELDEIDTTLETDAEAFVRGFVMKGGQGWSSFLDPSFFIGAAAAAVAGGAAWDGFKIAMAKTIHALRRIPGAHSDHALKDDGSYNPDFEHMLEGTWETARRLIDENTPDHTLDEATALHWVLFYNELQNMLPAVRLDPSVYAQLTAVAATTPERLSTSQLVARIVDAWLRENPNAQQGSFRV